MNFTESKKMRNKILHIKTGGTIAGRIPEYKEIEYISDTFTDCVNFEKYITQTFKITNPYSELDICYKDSREINEDDRKKILDGFLYHYKKGVRKFLITHGTYTMPETGRYLLENIPKQFLDDSLIIITGSMYPWVLFGSDAPFNLGASITTLIQHTINGVYICMHGGIFDPRHIQKDNENLIFKTKN